MKKLWMIGILGLVLSCNDKATVTQTNDQDHTQVKDTIRDTNASINESSKRMKENDTLHTVNHSLTDSTK
jgi:hypothetical protein